MAPEDLCVVQLMEREALRSAAGTLQKSNSISYLALNHEQKIVKQEEQIGHKGGQQSPDSERSQTTAKHAMAVRGGEPGVLVLLL